MSADLLFAGMDPALAAEFADVYEHLDQADGYNLGFPAATDIDYRPLAPFLRFMLNNLGDPFHDGRYPMHTKTSERTVLSTVADLLRAPAGRWWGYITSGASEGTFCALEFAQVMHPRAVIYRSRAAHHSVRKAVRRTGMPSVVVRAGPTGEMDYTDLATQVSERRDRPAIVTATAGTAFEEATDDVATITAILDDHGVDRWVHVDGALAALPLATLDLSVRPRFDFTAGTDSMIVSGHKFLGTPVPCGVFLVRRSHRPDPEAPRTYTGAADSALTNSRSGFAVLALYYALRYLGFDGLRQRAEQARALAVYAQEQLLSIDVPATVNPHAMTVVFPTPPSAVTRRWPLAAHGRMSHILCVPGVPHERIDRFVADLRTALTGHSRDQSSRARRRSGTGDVPVVPAAGPLTVPLSGSGHALDPAASDQTPTGMPAASTLFSPAPQLARTRHNHPIPLPAALDGSSGRQP